MMGGAEGESVGPSSADEMVGAGFEGGKAAGARCVMRASRGSTDISAVRTVLASVQVSQRATLSVGTV